ncbi:hypothetical protein NEHOM01_1374 [Nematocida homosporus]|uniref:uncharacterized protein n=1 Tax=Nematocida homosporus TaxID=1912981 RepID=UPI0022204FD5|nr:uncharacterized protein NEHOM01_1374 [Nematocida homosporus]KAI5186310.1 hypothetical protein NEHOM01_1374 [Nematocida homosporus]
MPSTTPSSPTDHLLAQLSEIKNRLTHLALQRSRLASLPTPTLPPFSCSPTELLRKVSSEEDYLLTEAQKLIQTLQNVSPTSLDPKRFPIVLNSSPVYGPK